MVCGKITYRIFCRKWVKMGVCGRISPPLSMWAKLKKE